MDVLDQVPEIVNLALEMTDPLLVLLVLSIYFAELADRLQQPFPTGGRRHGSVTDRQVGNAEDTLHFVNDVIEGWICVAL